MNLENTSYIRHLDPFARVDLGITQPMIAWLCGGQSLNVLDAGCGEGAAAMTYAEAGCFVTGIDADVPSLEKARQLLAATSFADRVMFSEENILQLPFANDQFDLVWCSYALHHIEDKLAAAHEVQRVLKPGGRFAIREGGLPLQMLPFDIGLGEPGLQERLHLADSQWFAAMTRDTMPHEVLYPYGWLQLLLDMGLINVTARTFTLDLLPPFDSVQSAFVISRLQRPLDRDQGEYGPFLSDKDRKTIGQLLDPQSTHYIVRRTDLHVRYGSSIYVGQKQI